LLAAAPDRLSSQQRDAVGDHEVDGADFFAAAAGRNA
jgi:hypothetical protein